MKKYWKLLLVAAGIGLFTACEDVPEPYNIPTDQGNNTPKPTGIEVTCAEAVELTSALADGATSAETYTITGYITEIVGEVSKNQQTFWMADTPDGGRIFEAYWANLPEGVSEFKVGSKVKITGKLMKYVNNNTGKMIPEIKNATIEILEDGGDTPTPTGKEVTCAQAVELTSALADGATSAETYTITGYITEIVGEVSKNQQTFWMADTPDGGRIFEAYWANLPEGVSEFKVGSKVKITGKLMKYVITKSGQVIPEIKNATVEILEDGGDTPTPTGKEVTCAQAVELANALADGASSDEAYTITGYITEVVGSVSKNQQTFWMADTKDGGRVFEAYYANLPTGVSEFKVGSKVKITGQLMKYVKNDNVTPEIKNATVEILEEGDGTGGGDVTGEAKGSGTLSDPFNAVAAIQEASKLSQGETSSESYYVMGKISQIKYTFSAQYGTATFSISEDGTTSNEFLIYSTYYLGNKSWVDGNTQIKVGDDVIIYGQFTNYKGTFETASKKSYIYSLNGETEGGNTGGGDTGGDNTGGDTSAISLEDFTNGDFETWADGLPTGWKSACTASSATLSQSSDAHGGQYSVCVQGTTSGNKRIAYQEMTLEAGTYTCSFWTKAATEEAASLCPGYAVPGDKIIYNYDEGDDGKNKYVNDITQTWQEVTYSFTLDKATTLCLIIMNSKTTGTNLLVDDFTITKN